MIKASPKEANKKSTLKISVVVPVYNNGATLVDQLHATIKEVENVCQEYEIIVSNDKSTDDTKSKLNSFADNKNIKVFHQKTNLGIAKNILFLYKKVQYPYIVLFSIDGDWESKDVSRLIMSADNQKADIVIGKRSLDDFPFSRKVVSIVYNFLPVILFGVKTYDTGSIKIIKKDVLDSIRLTLQTVSFESEFLIKAAKKGYKISSIPIRYKKNSLNKQSSVNIKLIAESFVDLLRLRVQGWL